MYDIQKERMAAALGGRVYQESETACDVPEEITLLSCIQETGFNVAEAHQMVSSIEASLFGPMPTESGNANKAPDMGSMGVAQSNLYSIQSLCDRLRIIARRLGK